MATINLGRIKPVWQGTWTTGTAYVKDDIVREGVDSYICVTAHTAGATFAGDSANWELMAQGSTIPSQTGNANSYLQTDGTNLQWSPVESDYVNIASSYGGTTSVLHFPSVFSDNPEFRRFHVLLETQPVSSTSVFMRLIDSTGTTIQSGYDYIAHAQYQGASAGSTQTWGSNSGSFRMHDFSTGAGQTSRFSFSIANVGSNETDLTAGFTGHYYLQENSVNYVVTGAIGGNIRSTTQCNGFQLYCNGTDFNKHRIAIYGIR